MKRKTKQL